MLRKVRFFCVEVKDYAKLLGILDRMNVDYDVPISHTFEFHVTDDQLTDICNELDMHYFTTVVKD